MKHKWSRVVSVLCSLSLCLALVPSRAGAWSVPNTRAIVLSGFVGGDIGAGLTRVEFDANDNMILSGRTAGQIQVNPGDTSQRIGTGQDWQEYVSKFSSRGDWQWTATWPSVGGGELSVFDVKVAPNGEIIVGATLNNIFDVDPGAGTVTRGSASGSVGLILSLDPNGQFKWAREITSSNQAMLYDLAVLSDGNIVVGGSFTGTVNFDGPGGPTGPSFTAVSEDAFVASFTSTGVENWAAAASGSSVEYINEIEQTQTGAIIVAGGMRGATTFTPGTGSPTSGTVSPAPGHIATFVWNLTVAGATTWLTIPAPATSNSEGPHLLVPRRNGEIILGTDDRDIHLLNSSGVVTSTVTTAGLIDTATELTNGKILLGGAFANTADLDPTAGVDNRTSVNGSLNDGFVTRLSSTMQYESTTTLQMSRFVSLSSLTGLRDGGWVLTGVVLSGTIALANPVNGTSYSSSAGADSMIFVVRYNSDGTTTVPVPAAPTATAYVTGNKKVTIRWESTQHAARYMLMSSSGRTLCDTTATSCVVNRLTNGKTYTLTLKALNHVGVESSTTKIRAIPGFNLKQTAFKTGQKPLLRSVLTTPSKGTKKWGVSSGGCRILGSRLVIPSRSGSCTVTLSVTERGSYPAMKTKVKVTFLK